jgi:hypothetical protein
MRFKEVAIRRILREDGDKKGARPFTLLPHSRFRPDGWIGGGKGCHQH